MVVLLFFVVGAMLQKRYRTSAKVQDDNGSDFAPAVGRSASTMRLLPGGNERGRSSGRAAAAAALLDDCDDDEDEPPPPTRKNLADLSGQQIDDDAQNIYGMGLAEENGPSPRYELPDDLDVGRDEGDDETEIGPDDSISVAWFKTHQPEALSAPPPPQHGRRAPRAVPVTIEATDGSRHAMDVELDGLRDTAELRRGMLQGYCDLLSEQLPAHALHVHARLASGSSILLLDSTPLTQTVLDAVSFYVHAARDAKGATPELHAADHEVEAIPSLAQRKERLAMHSAGRVS